MDSNYKNLKDKLNTPSSLPNELNWENMEDGILSKMEALDETGPRKGRKNRRFIFFLLLGLLALVSGTLLLYPSILIPAQEDQNPMAHTSVRPESPTDKKPLESTERTSMIHENTDVASSVESTLSSAPVQAEGKKISRQSTRNFSQKEIKRTAAVINVESDRSEKPVILITDNKVPSHVDKIDVDPMSNTIDIEKKRLSYGQLEYLKGHSINTLSYSQESEVLSDCSILTVQEKGSSQLNKYNFRFSSGVSFWDFGFGSNEPIRNEFEKSMLSYTAQLNYQYDINNRFFLITGVVYHRLESRLNWSNKIEDYKVTLEDVVIETRIDALTGEREIIRGDMEVEVEAERRVRHHNMHTLVQMPFGAGIQHHWGALTGSLNLGTSVNILGSSKGRLLQDSGISDYEGNSNPFYQNQWAFHGFLETTCGYAINDSWNLIASIGYQKSLSNWSLEEGVEMRPQILSVQLGLTYHIK